MRRFTLKHFDQVQWWASMLGAAGIGHVWLSELNPNPSGAGLAAAWLLIFIMAWTKVYLHHVATGARFWPHRGA